ncbi:putative two-component histidine kinase [Nocardia brasiliensis NBRC 14402]|uniref:sensor histidine kinase n=1 Tax=Nocardia brasiliensis TaxID=37326 RepID=UPI000317A66D|nr:histidine kinase [Nocardia brasiliensis]ASF06246.1 two-component sensor histidine kinase [Nocardia brasiliensis]GAJ82352.1 putative two-component histidine kinase [Nocardia brasiliensis NBRC 14402]SUB53932.1 Sensor protein vraS [Nocardia brasiliensis]
MRQWSEIPGTARDALGALLVFAGGAALYASNLFALIDLGRAVPFPARLAILAPLCLLTMARRRMPVPAMLVGLIPLSIDIWIGPSVPVWLIYGDLMYAAVLYSAKRTSRGVIIGWATFSVLLVLVTAVVAHDLRAISLALLVVLAFIATPLWWANSVRTHKDIAGAERARAQALTLVAELDRRAAIADERTTMARDLHDVIAGHLSAIAIQSEAALGVLARKQPDAAVTGIMQSIRTNSVSALQEMRTMIGLLRSDGEGEDEVAAPRRLAQLSILVDAARAAGIAVRVSETLDDTELPSAVDQAAYRIIQEALTNAMKHAPGQGVDIDVSARDGELRVAVRNPVPAITVRRSENGDPHRGLINMRERAAALGGSFTAGSNAGTWEVQATLPVSIASAS